MILGVAMDKVIFNFLIQKNSFILSAILPPLGTWAKKTFLLFI